MTEEYDLQDDLNTKLKHYFEGKIVRKDLTKRVKEGANVPVYVLEYLLGKYCSQDDALVEQGVQTVKNILANNYVRPDEAQKILSKLKELGSYSIIDVVTVKLDYKTDTYYASFSNLGLNDIPINPEFPQRYERLLGGNLWCMVNLEYDFDEADFRSQTIKIRNLQPIQLPNIDLADILSNRKNFTKEEWIDILLRSCGMEPTQFDKRVKWLLIARLIPLVENNFNLCELGPRGTGKSHIYKEISPNSILVSGGQTTVANLFYNMRDKQIGLVGMWDCVAFDEVAGIKFKDQDGIAIMKDFMASGSFSRGKEEKNANASMVFVGNINQSVESLLKTSSLFDPFPSEMGTDTAFFDRMHCYIPGWEIPKYRPEFFTDDFGFITDYLSEFFREMRKRSFTDAYQEYFRLGRDLNQRDTIAVNRMVSGLVKLVYPDGNFDKEDIREILTFALESRRRVKEQLKKIGGMEFYDVNFSYIDLEENRDCPVGVEEQASSTLIPEGDLKPGHLYSVGPSENGKLGVYKFETEMMKGNGKFTPNGIGSKKDVNEAVKIAYQYFKSNAGSISGQISYKDKDYVMQVKDLHGVGMTRYLTLATFIALCSVATNRKVLPSLAILGNFSLGGTVDKIQNLADTLQVCLDNGAKKLLIPMSSYVDIGLVPSDLLVKFTLIPYNTPEEAVMKAFGIE
ncbi:MULTISPECIES: protease Lon-related BREX system protein BrxL [Methanobrevibacter]|jgi:Predicted ATP-dependent Lon-type protease|uniref:Predicted ATP-dependent protease La, Lon n=1 Tax=Methanobrevibacter smithii (strain ATCC 35061 / DSM 861 / OCM 144 / PS) TaxID=420247 RepID=A5UP31_METS3|nr:MULTISPECIES: protease Lon-related BREX system protein BrxL [Methanobrevibacter]ABQ87959.1 predicted ATP-dependent protease La, Lon [Methanobrevibacter smithii ATCC 35061]OED06867.1 TIGR02688 family protein [Methanobrevibacter sp. A54]